MGDSSHSEGSCGSNKRMLTPRQGLRAATPSLAPSSKSWLLSWEPAVAAWSWVYKSPQNTVLSGFCPLVPPGLSYLTTAYDAPTSCLGIKPLSRAFWSQQYKCVLNCNQPRHRWTLGPHAICKLVTVCNILAKAWVHVGFKSFGGKVYSNDLAVKCWTVSKGQDIEEGGPVRRPLVLLGIIITCMVVGMGRKGTL